MISAHLISYSAISSSYPCFVIPVFSIVGSNLSYAQDLTLDGKVKEFKLFHDRSFFTIPAMPADIKLFVGQAGIAAYWAGPNEVWVGEFDQLKQKISDINEDELPAFVAVEAMTLLGDTARLTRAADRASKLIKQPSASKTYRSKIVARSIYMKKVSERQLEIAKSKPDDSIDQILLQLQSDLTDNNWYSVWSESWRKFQYHKDLFGILKWKIDSGFGDAYQSVCVGNLARSNDEEYEKYALNWLSKNYLVHSGWPNVWFALNERSIFQEFQLSNLAIKFLSSRVVSKSYAIIDHQWCMIWSRLWRESYEKDELEDIAMRASSLGMRHYDSFVHYVLRPIRRNIGDTEWILSFYETFLSRPQANRIWVQSYIEMFDEFSDIPAYRKAGVEWLMRLGSGMNLWAELWRVVQRFESRTIVIDLSLSWLVKARKNISSWPIVFEETFQLMNNRSSDRLTKAAQLWMVANSQTQRNNKLIRAVADGDIL